MSIKILVDTYVLRHYRGLPDEVPRTLTAGITLREMKHSFPSGNRVLSLLVLESAAPRKLAGSGWEDEHDEDSYDRFNK